MRKYGKSNAAARVMDDKGFYIILTICALAIVVSGYVLFFMPSGVEDTTMEADVPNLPVTVPVAAPTVDLTEDEPIEETTGDEEQPEETPAEEKSTPTAAPVEEPSPVWVRPVEGEVVMPFSGDELVYHATFGDWRVHTGTDYAASEGDRVYAVTDGTVEQVWMDSLNGQCVRIAHADGLTTTYMGLKESPKVKEGGTVKAGDVIGSVGDTNSAESAQGAHLHLEARVGDRPVDIETFLTGTEGE